MTGPAVRTSRFLVSAGVVLTGAIVAAPASQAEGTSTLTRPADPVVITASRLGTEVLGVAPPRLVAFRWTDRWTRVPVQVDERVEVSWADVRHFPRYDLELEKAVLYVDEKTGTGIVDDIPTIDGNDEVVLMARDAGALRQPGTSPPGVVAGSGVEVKVTDPLPGGGNGYLYLFTSTQVNPTQPSTGVAYDFDLSAPGTYLATYGFGGPARPGPNPENSTVSTPTYRTHFADRWLRDRMHIGASGDLIDREKVLFEPDYCGRTVTSANYAGGAFIANKVGPVRAIRSYVAFNSGLITQRDHFFYDQREVETTYLRVHAVPGAMSFLDFSQAARGMTYTAQRSGSVPPLSEAINGSTARPLDLPALEWDMVSGSEQGTIVRSSRVDASKVEPPDEPPLNGEGVVVRSYYEDDDSTPTDRCNDEVDEDGRPLPPDDADGDALGSSGVWIQPAPPALGGAPVDYLPCTDPLRDLDRPDNPPPGPRGPTCVRRWDLTLTTSLGFIEPGTAVTPADAQIITDRATMDVRTTVRPI